MSNASDAQEVTRRKPSNTRSTRVRRSTKSSAKNEKPKTGKPKKKVGIPDHETVAERAFEIWQNEGCPQGRDLEHWLQAEIELRFEAKR